MENSSLKASANWLSGSSSQRARSRLALPQAPARIGQSAGWALADHRACFRQRSALHSVAGRWPLLAEWKWEMTAGSASIHKGSSAEDGACGIEAHVMLGQPSSTDIVAPRKLCQQNARKNPWASLASELLTVITNHGSCTLTSPRLSRPAPNYMHLGATRTLRWQLAQNVDRGSPCH